MASRHLQAILGETTNIQSKRGDAKKTYNHKRQAEKSPAKLGTKRPAFGDLTNAAKFKQAIDKANAEKNVKKLVIVRSKRKPDSVTKRQEQNLPTKSSLDVSIDEETFEVPVGVVDYDKENIGDPHQEPIYSTDIFRYYKKRELKMKIVPYMQNQPNINELNRTILVDWMVEVQESFELNHETLYLAVKLVDLYLMKTQSTPIEKSNLQLVGATAVFLACKFDERIPPLIDDFLYICEDAYSRKDLIQMEISILKAIEFDLGIPLSYRFLRRYARTAKLSMEVLTLSRYILEMSLMKYSFIGERDSLMAAAALSLALRMKNRDDSATWWSKTLEYYSGYKISDLECLVQKLNSLICLPIHKKIKVIKTKYSHKVFFEVAKVPPMDYAV